ncbi:MAG TPA: hypothetical protein VGL03_07850 [Thermoanaerobaculia bacterium]|jgi:Cu/Ag efflux protein CusF
MKRILVLSLVMVFALSAAAVAIPQSADTSQSAAAKSIRGTISSVDQNAKMLVVKDNSGKDITVYWNDATRLSGDLKEGATVSLQTTEQGGKTVATSIEVSGTKKPY